MATWRCLVCHYVEEGASPPQVCPLCDVGPEKFVEEEKRDVNMDVAAMKTATRKVQYGLFVVAARDGDKLNGQVSNAVMQVTTNPTSFAVAVLKKNYTADCILGSRGFTVNILGEDNHRLVRRFGYRSGREFDKFKGLDHKLDRQNLPYLTDTVGWFSCSLQENGVVDCDTHYLFLGDVVEGAGLRDDVKPMTYAFFRATK